MKPVLFRSDLDMVVKRLGRLQQLKGARIFVTGGTGFVGRWMLETLLWADERFDLRTEVAVLSRDTAAFARNCPHLISSRSLRMVQGDVRTFDFPEGRFDTILHLAAETNADLSDPAPEAYMSVIVGGTQRVLDFANAAGASSLLFVSSGAVYGSRPAGTGPLKEDDDSPMPGTARSAYGEAKMCAENLVRQAAAKWKLRANVARCFAFVGPYLPLHSGYAVGNFIADAMAEREIVVRGDGSPSRTYLYAADMAWWLWTIALAEGQGGIYNVGSDEVVTISDLAALVAAAVGDDVKVRVLGESDRVGVGSSYVPAIDRARDELGLAVAVPLSDALARTVAWHRQIAGGPSQPAHRVCR